MQKRIKSMIATGAAAAVLLTGGGVYAAGGGVKKSIEVIMNGVNLVVDGQTIPNDNILYNGTTYVPIRAVGDSLDKEIKWDAATSTVEINDKGNGVVEKDDLKIYGKAIKYKDQYTEVDMKIPVIEGLKNTALMNQINSEFEQKALDFKAEAEKLTKANVEDSKKQGWPIRTGSVNTEYQAGINNNGTLYISVTYYQYTGGAHGDYFKESLNLDLKNEKQLALKDLFSGDYKQVMAEEILKQMNNEKDQLFPETLTDFKATDDLNFYLADDALVIYFNIYEIAPYARGIVEYKIPYSQLKDVLNQSYVERLK